MKTNNKPELINRTTAYCIECGTHHGARVERLGNTIWLRVFCPQREGLVQLSSDAHTFLQIRKKSTVPFFKPSINQKIKWTHVVEITNDCNYSCPICFNVKTRDHHKTYLSVDEILRRADSVCGRKSIILSGGEPTCHPDLLEIVRQLTKRGFKVSVATNGSRIGLDKSYLRALKKNGVNFVWLTFDAISDETHKKMRGCSSVKNNKKTLEALVGSGLRVGVNYAATSFNLPELEKLLEYFATLAPLLCAVHIAVASPVGIYEHDPGTIIDRETVINAISSMGIFRNTVNKDDFLPPPEFVPWGPGTHPDCSANLILLSDRKNKELRPLNRFLDMEKLYGRLKKNTMKPNFVSKNIVPLFHALSEVKNGFKFLVLRHLFGIVGGVGSRGVLLVTITTFITKEFQDDQRLARCSLGHITKHGELISPCVYNYPERLQSMYGKK